MKGQYVSLGEHAVEGVITTAHSARPTVFGEQHFHAERTGQACDATTDVASAKNPERGTLDVENRLVMDAEMRRARPLPGSCLAVTRQMPA